MCTDNLEKLILFDKSYRLKEIANRLVISLNPINCIVCARVLNCGSPNSPVADGGVRVNALTSISDYDHWPPRQSPAGVRRGIPSQKNKCARSVVLLHVNTGVTNSKITQLEDAIHVCVGANASHQFYYVFNYILRATRNYLIF